MVRFQDSALAYALQKGQPLYLEMAPIINGCCLALRESPAVRFGEPANPECYHAEIIEGVTVYLPYELPDIPLEIALASFLGLKKLTVQGWRLA